MNYKFKEYTENEQGEGYCINFTRANFKDSFPESPKEDDFILSDERAKEQVAIYDVWDEKNNPITEMPSVNTDETSYTLSAMRGVDFDDEKWDHYMNQFSKDKLVEMFANGG